jgi:hypothetical protein
MAAKIDQLKNMLQASPSLFPLHWDRQTNGVEFVGLTDLEYDRASFLDERALSETSIRGIVPFPLIGDLFINAGVRSGFPGCDFIFHISHCGSTLLSRLLGLHEQCFALREPKVLRTFDSQSRDEIFWLFGLLSRTFSKNQKSLIKATSFTNQFAVQWLNVLVESRAILLSLPLEPFLAAVLDGSSSDIEAHKRSRSVRLKNLGFEFPENAESLSIGQSTAMSWLCESLTLERLATAFPSTTLGIDFDSLIKSPEEVLLRCADFLGYDYPHPDWIETSLWQQYAKKPEVLYDSRTRDKLLNDSRRKYAKEIQAGIDWVENIQDSRVSILLNR